MRNVEVWCQLFLNSFHENAFVIWPTLPSNSDKFQVIGPREYENTIKLTIIIIRSISNNLEELATGSDLVVCLFSEQEKFLAQN